MLERMKEIMEQDELTDDEKEEFKSLQKQYNDLAEEMDTKANYKKYSDRLTTCARVGYAPTLSDDAELFSILIKDDEDRKIKDYFESHLLCWRPPYAMVLIDGGNVFGLEANHAWPGKKLEHTMDKWPTTKQHSQYVYIMEEEAWYFKDECVEKPKWIKLKKPMPKVDQAKFDFI